MQKTYAFFWGGQLQSQNFPKYAFYLGKCIFLAYFLHIFDFLRKMVENGKICKKYAKKIDFGVAPPKKCIFCLHIFSIFFLAPKKMHIFCIFLGTQQKMYSFPLRCDLFEDFLKNTICSNFFEDFLK